MARSLPLPSPFLWCVIAILASFAMLGGAHSFETFGGYAPCGLCLRQREVYWVAATAGILCAFMDPRARSWGPVVAFLLIAVLAVGAVALHLEWRWWVYLGLLLSAAAVSTSKRSNADWGRVTALVLTAIFAAGLIVAAFHAGVEWKWWPGPTSCSGGTGSVSANAMSDLLAGKKARPPACDEAAWRMFGISMAGYNALISAGLVVLGALVSFRKQEGTA